MTNPIPAGYEGIVPHLTCTPCVDAIEFYKKAFGAEELCRMPMPDGSRIMHAEIKIGDKILFLHDDFPDFRPGNTSWCPKALGGTPVTIHQYVTDCDAAMKRAVDAGATLTVPAMDMFWGDRYGEIMDPFGHAWGFATHIKDMTPEEMDEAAQAAFSAHG